MQTIHDQIDELLAADVHDQLSTEERDALHRHLVECADCRKLHQETKLMNKILEENLSTEKADPNFEQRMLAGFRTRVPQRSGLGKILADLMRLRAAQITAVAALLLALAQVGRMITHEDATALRSPKEKFAAGGQINQPISWTSRDRGEIDAKTKAERTVVTGSNIPTEAAMAPPVASYAFRKDDVSGLGVRRAPALAKKLPASVPSQAPESESPANATRESAEPASSPGTAINRKLIRNAEVSLEIVSFDEAVQKITSLANEEKGYVATSSSEKQANGKLSGQVVVKVLPENLDRFLQKLRQLGELKNQTLGTEDVTKAYLDTDSRLKNARVMEQRLIDMLKTKTGKVSDLLQVEKELGRVREEIEKMQGELKYWDAQVQFATVTIALAEKDLETPAAFLLKERAQLALYAPDVEKVYNDIKALASPKVQITNAQLDRDNSGRFSGRISLLIAPEESDGVITRVKALGRVENFQMQTERVAQGGEGMSENAKTKRDKVELNITISRDEQEQSFQQTSLRIRTASVDEKAKELRSLAEKQAGRVRSSSFSRDPDGREFANLSLRVPMKNYPALMQSLDSVGKVENVAVQRQDRTGGQVDEANAPADISIQVYSQGNIVSHESGLWAVLRRTLAQGTGALMWSLRMIGVAIAFLAPWVIALIAVVWIAKRIARGRRQK